MDNDLTKDAPIGSVFDAQPNGWITSEGFLKWMKRFVNKVNLCEDRPVLLIVDGHCSHKDIEVISFAKRHHVHMLSLPPHTTHKLQPLDRVVMKPFKNAYNEACSLWMRKNPKLKIGIKDIAGLVNCAFTKVCRMELCQTAFACTGIYLVNRNVFTDLDFHPSSYCPQTPLPTNPPHTSTHSSPGPSNLDQPSTSYLVQSVTSSPTMPSTSCIPHAGLVLQEISPLPCNASVKFNTRKRRGDQSEILTSSPYKSQLEEKRACLNSTKDKGKSLKGKTIKKSFQSVKNSLQFADKNKQVEEKTNCIICGENFTEDWIQCSICKDWAHENCANLEGEALFYKCNICKQKNKTMKK